MKREIRLAYALMFSGFLIPLLAGFEMTRKILFEMTAIKNAARKNPTAFQKLSGNYINSDKIPV